MIAATSVARRAARDTGFFPPDYSEGLASAAPDTAWAGAPPGAPASWSRAARAAGRGALSAATWSEWRSELERLGAPPPALDGLRSLAEGRAVAVVAGQQPEFLGGPLFTLYKAATAVAAARRLARDGQPAVPVFWVASEDSDFEEVRTARLATKLLDVAEVALPREACPRDGLVGNVPAAALAGAWSQAESALADSPAARVVSEWLAAVRRGARDLGEVHAAWLLRALGGEGLVPLDPRLPSFRRDAENVHARYLAEHAAIARVVDEAGARLEARGQARPIPPLTTAFALYEVHDGTRRKSDPASAAAALAAHRPLAGNVVLRAVTQDALLPAAAQIVGPGEAAYLGQLGGVYEQLGLRVPLRVPRLSATWLPAAVWRRARAEGWDPWALVADPDAVVRDSARRRIPAALLSRLEAARARAGEDFQALAAESRSLDVSLPQLVESARGKLDFQLGRLFDGFLAKARARLDHAHPEVARLRQVLRPGDKPQERRIGWLSLVAEAGEGTAFRVLALAEEHLQSLVEGRHEHLLFPSEEASA